MFLRPCKLWIAAGLSFLLAGCQSTMLPANGPARTSLEAAGFKAIDISRAALPTDLHVIGSEVFGCPKSRCGANTIVAFYDVPLPGAPAGATIEDTLRRSKVKSAQIKAEFETIALGGVSARHAKTAPRLTRFTVNPRAATLNFTMRFKGPKGETAYLQSHGRIVGNDMRGILAVSASGSNASRYARPEWVK